jgi:hypothetical protein
MHLYYSLRREGGREGRKAGGGGRGERERGRICFLVAQVAVICRWDGPTVQK